MKLIEYFRDIDLNDPEIDLESSIHVNFLLLKKTSSFHIFYSPTLDILVIADLSNTKLEPTMFEKKNYYIRFDCEDYSATIDCININIASILFDMGNTGLVGYNNLPADQEDARQVFILIKIIAYKHWKQREKEGLKKKS